MKKILILTLILNLGFCSGLPSNANANGDRHQLRMSFSDVLECPAQSLEIKTDSYTGNIGTMNIGTVNIGTANIGTANNTMNNVTIDSVTINYYYNHAVTPDVKAAGTAAQAKK